MRFYVSPSTSDQWGTDQLGDEVVHPGSSYTLHFAEGAAGGTCQFDLQIVTSEGQPYPFSFFASQGQLTLAAPIRRLENLGPGHYVLQVDGAEGKPFDVQQGGLSVLGLP